MKIDRCEFTIFDVETTGLFPYSGDKICEIAAIRVDSSCRKAKRFSSLVDPERPISYGAFSVNGITSRMVAGQPTIDKVLPGFLRFTAGSVLVAYNAPFDMGFIKSAMGEDRDILKSYFVIDALALARRFFPGAPRYNLGVLSRYLGIASSVEHRALADATMTLKVFEKELGIMPSHGIAHVEEMAHKDYKVGSIEAAVDEQAKLNVAV